MRWYLEDFSLLSSTCCKTEAARSVVFDRTSFPPLILAFCSSVHRCGPLHIYPCICSVAPWLRVLWMSTHGCFIPPFPPFYFFLVVSTRCWSLGSKRHRWWRLLLHRRCLLLHAARWRRPGVVRRIPGRRPAPLSICIPVCASHLMATCLTYVCTQILLLPLTRLWSSTCIRALEAPGLYYDACMTYFIFRVVLWYLPMSPWSWSYTFACMISVRLNRGRHIGLHHVQL